MCPIGISVEDGGKRLIVTPEAGDLFERINRLTAPFFKSKLKIGRRKKLEKPPRIIIEREVRTKKAGGGGG